jgi:hypothetical protein
VGEERGEEREGNDMDRCPLTGTLLDYLPGVRRMHEHKLYLRLEK